MRKTCCTQFRRRILVVDVQLEVPPQQLLVHVMPTAYSSTSTATRIVHRYQVPGGWVDTFGHGDGTLGSVSRVWSLQKELFPVTVAFAPGPVPACCCYCTSTCRG